MKRNFSKYLFITAAMPVLAAYSFQAIGQSNNSLDQNQNVGQAIQPARQSNNFSSQSSFPQNTPVYQSQPSSRYMPPGVEPGAWTQPIPPALAPAHNHKNYLTVMNKDREIRVIEKEPGVGFTPEEMEQSSWLRIELQSAIATIKSPDAEDANKKDYKKFIAQFLKAEFKRDQDSRREQVERLEKQVEQLKKQLAKREESQDKLIELRLQLLENDASGLSFPETWSTFANNPTYTASPYPQPVPPSPIPNAYVQNNPNPNGPFGPIPLYSGPNSYPTNNAYDNPLKNPTEAKKR